MVVALLQPLKKAEQVMERLLVKGATALQIPVVGVAVQRHLVHLLAEQAAQVSSSSSADNKVRHE